MTIYKEYHRQSQPPPKNCGGRENLYCVSSATKTSSCLSVCTRVGV